MPPQRKIIGALLFAGLWIGVAAIQPTTTFHLAPTIVAAWPAVGEQRLERAIPLAIAGLAIAAVATGLLTATGLLQGPSLLPWGGAGLESILAALLGALIGVSLSVAAGLTSSNG